MKQKKNFTVIFTIGLMILACKKDQIQNSIKEEEKIIENEDIIKKRKLNYEIVNTDILETEYKAQITKYVAYNDSIFNEDLLSDVMFEVYLQNLKAKVFKNYIYPTVIAVYVFTTKEHAKNNRSDWISMLLKIPNKETPTLTFNKQKLKSLSGINDKIKSQDEIALENLNEYFKKKKITLCDLYNQFGGYELKNIQKADLKYPDYGQKHSDYVTTLNNADKKRIMKKYNLADSIHVQTIVFGQLFCK